MYGIFLIEDVWLLTMWVHTLSFDPNVSITGNKHSSSCKRDSDPTHLILQGMSYGPTSNLFLLLNTTEEQPCAIIVLDKMSGAQLACYTPDEETAEYFKNTRSLAYSPASRTHYSIIPSILMDSPPQDSDVP